MTAHTLATQAAGAGRLAILIARLDAAIAIAPPHMDVMARRYRSRLIALRRYADDPYTLGLIGPNGIGPAIEDAIRQCRPHDRWSSRVLDRAIGGRSA